jgi:hypothetical protein
MTFWHAAMTLLYFFGWVSLAYFVGAIVNAIARTPPRNRRIPRRVVREIGFRANRPME